MLYLAAYLLLEPVKRVLSAVLYPVAYALRRSVRFHGSMWPEYLYWPRFTPLWVFLDDSVEMEFWKEYADNPKYYPAWVWASGSDFLRAYWWAAIRNSCVNWNNYSAFRLGSMTAEEGHAGRKNFYITRTFASGAKRPYCEFYLFGRWNQVGWISRGRFEIDVMKRRA
jgi:hypothetical protein